MFMLPQHSPKIDLYINQLHKPIGIVVFVLAFLAIVWKLINPHPAFPNTMPQWEKTLAYYNHWLLYILLLIMSFTGFATSMLAGKPPNFFGLYQFPVLEENKALSNFLFEIHEFTAYLLVALIIVHILAALKHHFIDRDVILKRMIK